MVQIIRVGSVQLNEEQTGIIRNHFEWYRNRITANLGGHLRGEVGQVPPEVAAVEEELQQLEDIVRRKNAFHNTISLPDKLIPFFKRMMIDIRRASVATVELSKEKTHDPDLLDAFDKRLAPLSQLMSERWFQESSAAPIPLLSRYIPLKRVEELIGSKNQLQPREFDQKFRILQAPALIVDDLSFYRERCALRGTGLILAFADIDDFKHNFNEKYGEIMVDRRVLPLLMAEVEAHVFHHGFAYRHGGDEFVLIVPNISIDIAIIFLDLLRRRIEQLRYPGLDQDATLSIGFVYVDSDCFLTDREVVDKANKAKKFAKGTTVGGKNRIASYKGTLFEERDLQVVEPRYPGSV